MKILSYSYKGNVEVGILKSDGLEVVPINEFGFKVATMLDFIDELNLDKEKLEKIDAEKDSKKGILKSDIKVVAPIQKPKGDIICLGVNYFDHAEESVKFHNDTHYTEKTVPIYFSKRVFKAVGDKEPINGHFDIVKELDYEVELGVIIGRDAKNVDKKDVKDYILGYTIINDMSARDLQLAHTQWYFGKSLDGYTSMGQHIVTKDEFSYPIETAIKCYVNGELRQNSNTSMMITKIDEAIEELSRGMTLEKGTVIAMGTPAGVGIGFDPPKYLKSGDVIRCEIEGIGVLENEVE